MLLANMMFVRFVFHVNNLDWYKYDNVNNTAAQYSNWIDVSPPMASREYSKPSPIMIVSVVKLNSNVYVYIIKHNYMSDGMLINYM